MLTIIVTNIISANTSMIIIIQTLQLLTNKELVNK